MASVGRRAPKLLLWRDLPYLGMEDRWRSRRAPRPARALVLAALGCATCGAAPVPAGEPRPQSTTIEPPPVPTVLAPAFLSVSTAMRPALPAVILAPSVPGRTPMQYGGPADASLSPAADLGRGGRPHAPTSAGQTPAHRPAAPFFSPFMMGGGAMLGNAASGGGMGMDLGSNPDAFYAMYRPMMAMRGKHPPSADPNVIPAVRTMLMKSIPKSKRANDVDKAVTYGAIIAGMGGVHGMRGHSLKRLAGCAQVASPLLPPLPARSSHPGAPLQDSMMAGSMSPFNPFETKGPANAPAPKKEEKPPQTAESSTPESESQV